jgi:hypothetical protein
VHVCTVLVRVQPISKRGPREWVSLTVDADPTPTFHSDADPDPTFQSDADPDPDQDFFLPDLDPSMLQNDHLRLPLFHFDADPDSALQFDADPDPASQNYTDPCGSGSPQQCFLLIFYGQNVPLIANAKVICKLGFT